jgi:diguanylate cyclase (GGDEF)-like protein
MKIGERRPVAGPAGPGSRATSRGPAAASPLPPRAPAATASILGIPEGELTPKVRDAIMALMREVESLRRELDRHKARLAEVERLADQDALVEVHNRRAFVRELARVMSYTERYGGAASLLYFDLNELKAINDAFGHAAGDAALKQVAESLLRNVRDSDLVGRLGGDEFAVILAQVDEERALDKAKDLAAAIMGAPLLWDGRAIQLVVAHGVCALRPGDEPGHALARADAAMYSHKASLKSADF